MANTGKQQRCYLSAKNSFQTIPVMGKRVFTPEDRAAQKRLKTIWESKRTELGLTQEGSCEALGMNQSAVSQYLRGYIPLRLSAALRFAKLLKVKPTEIRPDLADLTSEVSPEALDWAQRYDRLSEAGRRRLLDALSSAEEKPVTHRSKIKEAV